MDYQQFVSAVEVKVQACMKEGISVHIHTAVKNNGKERKGITLVEQGVNISPTIYLEEYFEQFREGRGIDRIVDKILELYKEVKFQHSWEGDFLQAYDKVKEMIVYKVINKKANEKLLEGIPHITVLDLAVVFYVLLEVNQHGTATMTVTNEHLKIWGITEEELKKRAKENTERIFPAEFKTMNTVIRELLTEEKTKDEGADTMYVLTNKIRIFGAACAFYEGELEKIGEQLGEDFYVLPSSIHEVIIIPVSESPSREMLNEMIKEINETQVEEEEVLSDFAYYYDRKERKLSL